MIKAINKKIYNTDSARKVATDMSNLPRNDFGFWEETLYCKRTGEYFIYGWGGPSSRYSRSIGLNEWTGGERIIPLTMDKAREWAEKAMPAEDYQVEFGEIAEDETRSQISATLPSSMVDALRKKARAEGTTASALLEQALREAGY